MIYNISIFSSRTYILRCILLVSTFFSFVNISHSAVYRAEEFCSVGDLKDATRHTYVLLDESLLSSANSESDFSEKNKNLLQNIQVFINPTSAIDGGYLGVRERISFYILPNTGAPAILKYTGCLPAMTNDEREKFENTRSNLDKLFKASADRMIKDAQSQFIQSFLRALFEASSEISNDDTEAETTGNLLTDSVFRSLAATNNLIQPFKGVSRVVLYISLKEKENVATYDRERGFSDSEEFSFDFGRSDVVVIHDNDKPQYLKDYAESLILGRNGKLVHWGDRRIGNLDKMPIKIYRYNGEVTYPDDKQPVQIRIAVDEDERLVSSWTVIRGYKDQSTPMAGIRTCLDSSCSVKSGDPVHSFAGIWNKKRGDIADPKLTRIVPFGGLREFEFDINSDSLEGRIFDRAVDRIVGESGNQEVGSKKPGTALEYLSVKGDFVESALF